METARPTARPAPGRVESRWWYWIAAAAAFWVLAYVLGVVGFVLGVGAFLGGVFFDPTVFVPGAFGLLFVVVVPLVLFGLLVSLVLPVALYLDAEAVGEAGVGWEPDPVLYALVAAVGLFAQGLPVQPAVAVYYLYLRRRHVGTP
ncbi:hypothetical protein [Halomarina ordinaria]|uniref:Cox cluster protein n=1 Tax=Halomarina ordinaria TaxID=3033939 RepID=A0ABD5UDE8_9EURY|nr:hypothetical protein [Halomarina sp. PSRA2]